MGRPVVLIPPAEADHPAPRRLGAIAAVAFVVGVLLARFSLVDATTEATIAPQEALLAATGAAIPRVQKQPSPSSPVPMPAEEPDVELEPETPVVPRRVGLGRVAYLDCAGARPQVGPFPCPRDRDLEALVWAALEGLPDCPTMPSAVGRGDLRLTFVAGAPVEIGTRSRGPDGLPDDPLLACLREPLAHVATSIRAHELLVSFHFALIAR